MPVVVGVAVLLAVAAAVVLEDRVMAVAVPVGLAGVAGEAGAPVSGCSACASTCRSCRSPCR